MCPSSIEFTPQGPVAPDSETVLQAQQEIWQAAFDNRLNTDPATPQGQLMASLAAIVQDKNSQLLYLANQFNPATAEGVFQDALAAIYFLDRQAAMPTVVQVTCTGLAGVVIAGANTSDEPARVRTEDGLELYCQTTGTIPESGSVTLPFACEETGPIEIEAHSVTTIVQAQPGWDTVSNETAGVLGRDVESQREFEERRYQSVALNSRSMLASVYARVGNIDGVIDLIARQNRTSEPITDNGVTLKPHSVYVAVLGGEDASIAEALYNSVSGGCDYNGNTSYVYTDPVTGAQETILFERPVEVAFEIHVYVRRTPSTSTTVLEAAAANIYADFYGETYENTNSLQHVQESERIHIGETVYASRFYCPVLSAGVQQIVSVTIGRKGSTMGNVVELTNEEYPSLASDDIHITVEDR